MRRTVGLLGMILVLLLAGNTQGGAQTAKVVPKGKIVLAWHTNMVSKWLDPQEHDGTATPDNFLNALHDALIKNYRETLFDHPGLAERYEFAPDAKSATFWLRPGIKFHNGAPVTVEYV
jgi:ABC-type transport system substrate-binding protein